MKRIIATIVLLSCTLSAQEQPPASLTVKERVSWYNALVDKISAGIKAFYEPAKPAATVVKPQEPAPEVKPTPEDIQKHLQVMGELKRIANEKELQNKKNFVNQFYSDKVDKTQTTALFSIDRIKKLIMETFYPNTKKKLVEAIIKQEKAHFHTHYAFYHAQNGEYRIYQDLYRKLYEFFNVSGELQNFTFLRFPGPASTQYDAYANISDFLKDELKKRGIINDNVNDTRTFVLSVNLSPFGNPQVAGEATCHYFLNAISWVGPDQKMYQDILTSFECTNEYVPDLIKLSQKIKTKEGSLFQIFIPKNLVNQYVYLSWRQGVPHDTLLLHQLFETTKIPASTINTVLGKYQDEWSTNIVNDPKVQALFEQAIDRINKGDAKISDILDHYANNPESLKGIEYLQARILLSNDLMLNPDSGVLIYRYTTIPEKTMAKYEAELTVITNKIIKKWIQDHVVNKTGQDNKTRAEKLFKLIDQQSGINR
jgi:hypothetical protein